MNNIFENISEKEKIKLLNLLEAHETFFKKDKDISVNVKDMDALCIVESGLVQILKTDVNGNRTIIEEIEENQVFGNSIYNIMDSDYTIITKEDTEIIVLDYKTVMSKEERPVYYNHFIKNLLDIYKDKIRQCNDRITVLTNKSIRDKLLAYFNLLRKGAKTTIIYLPFSFTDLADYLAVNRSAMSRELSNLRVEGLIEIQGRKIKLYYDKERWSLKCNL